MVLRRVPQWRAVVHGRFFAMIVYLGSMALLFVAAERAAAHLAALALRAAPTSAPVTATSRHGASKHAAARLPQSSSGSKPVTLVQAWHEQLRDDSYRRGPPRGSYSGYGSGPWDQRRGGQPWRYNEDDDDDGDEPYRREGPSDNGGWGGTYRTVCVRLCDGYYWPVSFATTPQAFQRDSDKCEASCGAPARLYVYRNPGGEPEDMADLYGQPYSRLKTAFLYRSQYDASCKCKADPWEQVARDRHRMYALEAAKRKGDRLAAQEFDELRDRLDAERRQFAQSMRRGNGTERTDAPQADRARPPSTDEERMSLGGSSSKPARAFTNPARIWRDTGDSSP